VLDQYGAARVQHARQVAEQFRSYQRSASPVVAKVASDNAAFVDQWAILAESYQSLSYRVANITAKLNATSGDLEDVRAKLANYGLTPTVGLLLRHKKEQLDQWQTDGSTNLFATDELTRSRQKQLELEMVRYDGADSTRQATILVSEAGVSTIGFQHAATVSDVQTLLQQRSQWLDELKRGYRDYQQKLNDLDSTATDYKNLITEYRELINRHIIWIRSDNHVTFNDVRQLQGGVAALFDSARSADFGYSLKRKSQADGASGIGVASLVMLLLLMRWLAKNWQKEISGRRRMRDATDNARKVAVSLLTIFISFMIPTAIYAMARWLDSGIIFESTLHAAGGLYAASLVALLIELPRQLLSNYGYIDKFSGIELPRRQRGVAYLTLIGVGLVLAAYIVTLASVIDLGIWRASVGRFGFIASLLLVAWTFHLAFRPSGGLLEPLLAKVGGGVIHTFRIVIYLIAVGFPLAMIVLSALGYGFTANEMIKRAIVTIVAGLVAATLWPAVKIIASRVWQGLIGATPVRRFDQYGEIKEEPTAGILTEHYLELKHHLAFLCKCALVVGAIVCFGAIWIDAFPTARMGNPVVWTVQNTALRSTTDAAGFAMTESVVELKNVTVLHLLLATATLFVAFQLAKLLPALFDALVLQRVSFDEGMEHFTLVLGRCLLFGAGCFIACQLIGIRWQAIQWLAVGLTIGVGFGLQDMVRNLFGGLVVLFEKPARLGDLITVGRVTGRVAAQKFRTTVLSDEEGREVIIPNKNFVSEEVVNWMGAGRLNVIPFEVAVTRDQRPADVCRVLQELVIEQPDVLLTPAPQATLVCVGKTSQRIEVRAWIEDGQDPSRYREQLLKVVTKFLREKDWLVANQPAQPKVRPINDEMSDRSHTSLTHRTRKRSA
jgi:small-conductance mechanosensitive channel